MIDERKGGDMPRHEKCRYHVCGSFSGPDQHFCSPGAKTLGDLWKTKQEIDIADCENCNLYKSKFIEYPLTITGLDLNQPKARGICFEPVRVRLCEDDQTYFGILLGDFPWRTSVTFSEEKEILEVSCVNNPCILLPEQKRIVFGAECWWSRLKPGENISDITDSDIENTWYVKLLREMEEKEENKS